jgi:hypothetical protein
VGAKTINVHKTSNIMIIPVYKMVSEAVNSFREVVWNRIMKPEPALAPLGRTTAKVMITNRLTGHVMFVNHGSIREAIKETSDEYRIQKSFDVRLIVTDHLMKTKYSYDFNLPVKSR